MLRNQPTGFLFALDMRLVNFDYLKDKLDLYTATQHTSSVSSISSKEIDFSPLLERAFFYSGHCIIINVMKPFIDHLSSLGNGEPAPEQMYALGQAMLALPIDRKVYRPASHGEELVPAARAFRPVSERAVSAGEIICLPSGAIHSTLAADAQPTYHLHLYGRPLRQLAPYASRCYVQ